MFSGIVEELGVVTDLKKEGQNITFTIASAISKDTYIDQSISHNGVCLTVIAKTENDHSVTAIHESLIKSNLGELSIGDKVNLEKAITMDKLMDGHMVQGHVDSIVTCISVKEEAGSWRVVFNYDSQFAALLVDKGSICLNGISLTLINPTKDRFEVAIIPYTWEHTNFHALKSGSTVNVEFDILGKYVNRFLEMRKI